MKGKIEVEIKVKKDCKMLDKEDKKELAEVFNGKAY